MAEGESDAIYQSCGRGLLTSGCSAERCHSSACNHVTPASSASYLRRRQRADASRTEIHIWLSSLCVSETSSWKLSVINFQSDAVIRTRSVKESATNSLTATHRCQYEQICYISFNSVKCVSRRKLMRSFFLYSHVIVSEHLGTLSCSHSDIYPLGSESFHDS